MKTCTNCPGATDHDTAHCPLFLLRELDAFTAELHDKYPEPAEGAQGELLPCPFCGGQAHLTYDDYVHDDLRPMPVVECNACHTWVRAESWNKRAALAQPPQAPEQVQRFKLDNERYIVSDEECDLVEYAQHDRIVGALRADDEALHLAVNALERKLDAALAWAAELESQLLDTSSERNAMQRQRDNEKRLFERECNDADELIRLMGFSPEHYRTDGGSINLSKLRDAVSQAGQRTEDDKAAMDADVDEHMRAAGRRRESDA